MENKKLRMQKSLRNKNMQIEYSFIKILTGSDLSRRRLPLLSIKSTNPGPIVWLTACIHGDEVGGIAVIQEIFKRIKKEGLLRGEIYAFPLMNPMSFETASRKIILSEEDLNRSFTGNKDGSLAERIADIIFTTIKKTQPTMVLDLHNDWRDSIPYTLIDPYDKIIKREAYEKSKIFSEEIGFPIVLDTDEIEKTLTHSLLKCNIPALALELGGAYTVNEKDVKYGVNAIWKILSYLKIVKTPSLFDCPIPDVVKGKILSYSHQPVSSTSGIIRFLVKPGEIVKKGQPIAKIYNAFGKLLETPKTLEKGIVLGYSDSSVSFPGIPIMAFGILS